MIQFFYVGETFYLFILKILLFIFGCTEYLLLEAELSLAAVSNGSSLVAVCRPTHCRGFSCCRAQALEQGPSSCGMPA